MGLLGFLGILGPTAQKSIFNSILWFGSLENWSHLTLGFLGLSAAFWFKDSLQRSTAVFLGLTGILAGVYTLLGAITLFGTALENPINTALHLVIGTWALWSSYAV